MIRESRSRDEIDRLVKNNADVFSGEFGFDEGYRELVRALYTDYFERDDDGEMLWVVEEDGDLLGSIGLFRESDDVARLRLLFVHPDIRNRGIGTELMRRALDFALKKGYSSIVLMTEDILEDAGRLYERFGFHIKERERRNMWGRNFELRTCERSL